MKLYHDLLNRILTQGVEKTDRTGTGTRSIFGHQMRFDLSEGFPLVTTKRIHWKSVVHELLWLLSGSTNVRDLQKHGVTIWDEWADKHGDLGPVYGAQWRSWPNFVESPRNGEYYEQGRPIDQISILLDQLRKMPDSRRLVVSAWNTADLGDMALAPCHCLFQFNTRPLSLKHRWELLKRSHGLRITNIPDLSPSQECQWHDQMDQEGVPRFYLDCQLYQRSADVFLGVPFNIASYALLTQMIAQVVNMVPGDFIWTGGDVHIYSNHEMQVREQLSRTPMPLPKVRLNPAVKDLFAFTYDDIELVDYVAHPPIKAPVAI